MKTNNLLQITLALFLLSIVMVSCGASLQSGIKHVQLDMTKQEVIGKLGNDYEVASMAKTEQGNVEVLRYTIYMAHENKAVPSNYYLLHFLNGKLVEVNQEDAIVPIPVHRPHPRPGR
ncbi:hypothetical protein [Prevotella sp. 10(H)]|uniref:hypothetical protein n=1 Tax=Prevotella sp. 10(H) TaxID=1158294 RepID=UPI0004A71CE6|nr:hypothetical protein [Prevotella sp. 10(H)]